MMAGPEPAASREQALVGALGAVHGHRRTGDTLELLAGRSRRRAARTQGGPGLDALDGGGGNNIVIQ